MQLLACLLFGPAPVEAFYQWPLHLTLVPWFEVSALELSALISDFETLAKSSLPLTINPGQSIQVGQNQKRSAYSIKKNTQLLALHGQLLAILEQRRAQICDPSFIGPNYLPHITGTEELPEKISCSDLFIAAKLEDGRRQIVQKFS